jgi:hypothetical protein
LYPNLSQVDYDFDESTSILPPPADFQDSFYQPESKTAPINLPPLSSPIEKGYHKLPSPPTHRELADMKNNHNSTSSSVQTVIANHNPTSARLSSFLKSLESDNQRANTITLNQTENSGQQIEPKSNEGGKQLHRHASNASQLRHHRSCPNLIDSSDFNDNESQSTKQSFKLDHLVDINPKRLFRNSKFRCRIHDVIDESGQFWLEVLYSKEDERKFFEIFKLFRLSSRISEPPRRVHPNKRVSAMYKNDWHRAVVVDEKCDDSSKVKVRFVDLGLVKVVDRTAELREIDEKFFNCPLKSLRCTINIDEDQKFKISKEGRKFFTRLIYKKVLFAKVVDFVAPIGREEGPVCKIVLGCQTHRGIIDVYMYLISKYDRKRYEWVKNAQRELKKQPELGPIVCQSPAELYETASQTWVI